MANSSIILGQAPKGWSGAPARAFGFIRRWPIFPIFVLSVLVLGALFAPLVSPHSPLKQSLRERQVGPMWTEGGSSKFILGTDHVGRDILSRIIHGSRISLMVAAVALASGILIGSTLGLVAGWYGGIADEVVARIVDVWLALPFLLVALVVVIIFGQSVITMMGVLAMVSWSLFVRNIRAEVLTLKTRDYVALAKVSGASTPRILVKHILPGVINTMVVIATLNVGSLILTEATLSFLGAGIPAPTPAWGLMISEGRDHLRTSWWITVMPGTAIFLVVMSLNFMGDWLRDRLDPRLRQI